MSDLPPIDNNRFNQKKHGYYGELGHGENAQIRFLQTAITGDELDKITLIENIPGSEKWDVRDLFQRDVDQARVTDELLPYLKNAQAVKYFNPLTLMLLPLAPDAMGVESELKVPEVELSENGEHLYNTFRVEPFFQFSVHNDNPAYSQVEWNDGRVRIVAIDGQHRLSALKRWWREPSGTEQLRLWTIPAVILGMSRVKEEVPSFTVLEIVRRTFVYINTYAETVNKARAILLDDESVNSLCVQELVQRSHANDCLDFDKREPGRIPLIFFDWRGITRKKQRVPSPASVKTTEEVRDWLEHYVLGDDFENLQSSVLALDDLVPPLTTFGKEHTLSHVDARRMRERFSEIMLPGLTNLLTTFKPYADYIRACTQIEKTALQESDVASHAFMQIRFGTSRASMDLINLVQEKYKELVSQFDGLKQKNLDELLALDIGMRGVMSSFGYLKRWFDTERDETRSWLEYSQWFTEGLNQVYSDGWFRSYEDIGREQREFLTHIVYDPSGQIVNYKLKDVSQGWGALLSLLLCQRCSLSSDSQSEIWDSSSNNQRTLLRRGFRKQHRSELKDSFKGTAKQFIAEVTRVAEESVATRLSKLQEYLAFS